MSEAFQAVLTDWISMGNLVKKGFVSNYRFPEPSNSQFLPYESKTNFKITQVSST